MSKVYSSKEELQKKILNGVNTLADNVCSTLGPRGRNVILHQKNKNPIITKDGVTVAKFIDFEDPFENLGAQIIRQASSQTNNTAGDGTTTATALARAILNSSQKYLSAGVSPIEIKKGIEKAVEQVIESLRENARPIMSEEDITHIATISANNDSSIGKLVATAVDKIGKDGTITVEEARSYETSLNFIEGFRFDSGYVSNTFVTDERKAMVRMNGVIILVTDQRIETVEEMLPALELAAREAKPLVVVADDIQGQALAALIMNAVRGTMKVVGIKAPRYGQERRNILKDLALSVGATLITGEAGPGLKDVKLEDLGKAKSVEVYKNMTTIVGGTGDLDDIDIRIESLKEEITQMDDLPACERLQERITRLSSGVAVIRVGAATEIEMVEKKHRIEDALEAVRSAQMEGVVPGGGVALLHTLRNLNVETENDTQAIGVKIIEEAIREPLRQMALNAGESPDLIVSNVEAQVGNLGYDFVTSEIVDMFEAGIIDPVKVTTEALRNASSAAGTLLTTNYAIVERD